MPTNYKQYILSTILFSLIIFFSILLIPFYFENYFYLLDLNKAFAFCVAILIITLPLSIVQTILVFNLKHKNKISVSIFICSLLIYLIIWGLTVENNFQWDWVVLSIILFLPMLSVIYWCLMLLSSFLINRLNLHEKPNNLFFLFIIPIILIMINGNYIYKIKNITVEKCETSKNKEECYTYLAIKKNNRLLCEFTESQRYSGDLTYCQYMMNKFNNDRN